MCVNVGNQHYVFLGVEKIFKKKGSTILPHQPESFGRGKKKKKAPQNHVPIR